MLKFIIKRLAVTLVIVFLVSIIIFAMVHTLPGDPARILLGQKATEQDLMRFRAKYGLDQPVIQQYFTWILGMFHGDFGDSIVYGESVSSIISQRLPRTLAIGIPSILISSILGIVLGIISALRRGKLADRIVTLFATIGLGAPSFWIGILLILLFTVQLDWLPMTGYTSPFENFGEYVLKAIMPVLCSSIGMIAEVSRQMRSNMLEVINQDYIRTAKSNGLDNGSIIYRHALKNAVLPVITIIGLMVGSVFGGSLVVEQIYGIAGIGSLMVKAINARDYMVIQNCVLMISLFTVLCNLAVDLTYGILDPRIRKSWR